MPCGTRAGLAFLVFLAVGLPACSMTPFEVEASKSAAAAAAAEGEEMLPRLQPYAFGVCYGGAFNEEADVEAEAAYLCGEGGRVVRQEEDFFWNGCSLSQPHRVSFLCFPPDKAKRLPEASNPMPTN